MPHAVVLVLMLPCTNTLPPLPNARGYSMLPGVR